jgi:release factor glutamine methyltransferase
MSSIMKIKELIQFGKEKLENIESRDLDILVLLGFVIKKDKAWILANGNERIGYLKVLKFKSLIKRRQKNEPVAYLTGIKEFYGNIFKVNKNVLIPRPETEVLVEEVLDVLKNKKDSEVFWSPSKMGRVLEIGAGSGAIIISLAKELENIKFLASDVSGRALKIARKNAKLNKVENKIEFVKSDLLEKIKENEIDVVIANLPYVLAKDKGKLQKDLEYEPQDAIYAEQNGLELIEKLLVQIGDLEHKPKYIFLEFDPRQTEDLKKMIKNILGDVVIEVKKDLAGMDRVVVIK